MNTDQLVEALSSASTFKDDVEKFKTDAKPCFEAIKDAAGKFFCYGCAATVPAALTNSDGSSTITQASSNLLLEKCYSTWKFMHRTGTMLESVAMIARSSNSNAPPPRAQDKPNFGGVPVDDILTAFKNCKDSITDAACTDANKASIVKANFNIFAPPKRCTNDNMDQSTMDNLPAPKQGSSPSSGSTSGSTSTTTTQPPKRVLQSAAVTTSSGDVAIGANGLDLTKTVTLPKTTASVDATATDTGISKVSFALFGSVCALFSVLTVLN